MNKLNLLLTLILGIMMLSCSSDDNNENTDYLIGTWYGISSTFNGNNSGIPENNILKFMTNNRVEFIYENFGNNGENISEFGNWSKNGNTLIISFDESDSGLEDYILEILELNESTLKWKTEIAGEGTLKETFNKNPNASVDLSDFQDFIFNFSLAASPTIQGEYGLIECRIILLETIGNGEILETVENFSGNISNSTIYLDFEETVKEFKVAGIKIEDLTGNFNSISLELYKAVDGNEVLNTTQSIENSVTIMYDFETGTETITSN